MALSLQTALSLAPARHQAWRQGADVAVTRWHQIQTYTTAGQLA